MIALVNVRYGKALALLAVAVILLSLHGLTPACGCRVLVVLLAGLLGCACAALQRDFWLKSLLLAMFLLNLAALGLERNQAAHLSLFRWLQWFVLA
ncbi:hypothetical protein SFA35_05305 [Pseudomonas sp. HR96]|uniref:hypothetical protein n=1 Tax=Pseudomonas sp. HR96 TaxID=1027966 RepID=UPI002A754110|nr:hypothetical protein [Pseudomonas sp. HR96]WPP00792.1 hypothetical protein SFA35_05305 [Pseudomonas sp. HR96]